MAKQKTTKAAGANTVKVDAETLRALRVHCQQNGRLLSWAASEAIRDWLDQRRAEVVRGE